LRSNGPISSGMQIDAAVYDHNRITSGKAARRQSADQDLSFDTLWVLS
jgi:hypothetical protein